MFLDSYFCFISQLFFMSFYGCFPMKSLFFSLRLVCHVCCSFSIFVNLAKVSSVVCSSYWSNLAHTKGRRVCGVCSIKCC